MSTSTDEGATTEVPVVAVSCCVRGKVPYQYLKKGRGYCMKNMRSSLDPLTVLSIHVHIL
jgi:hypothetical protein